ncbi:hypothetical protein [Perlucidibaca aquatica]|uniref:hypothetical protein n=1 Tax=Perlucidibaca aquatica TaxID=1852776 RepID=UPI00083B6BA9|nr:hypothetical protein [Perlucidibaca aquatica]
MIETLLAAYKRSDRDIDALTYVVIAFLLAFALRGAMLIYECRHQELWPLLPQVVPLLSVLVAVRMANRLISNGHILREDDRRQELVRTTHHLIAITKDLHARVGYAKEMLSEGGRPTLALAQIAKSIEERYAELLQRDGFRFMPGTCVDIIVRISGDIFGIGVLAEGMKVAMSEKPAHALTPIPVNASLPPPPRFDELLSDLQQLLDQLYELRQSIDGAKEKE